MKAPKSVLLYSASVMSGPQIAAFAKYDMVILAGDSQFATRAAAIRAINPACKIMLYLNWSDVGGNQGSSPPAALQQVSKEGWMLKQSPASSPSAPLYATYMPYPLARFFSPNTVKVGSLSGMKYGAWYVANIVPILQGIGYQDGFFLDVASLGPTVTHLSAVDATASGSITSVVDASTISDSTKSWGATGNAQAHRMVRMTSGACAGQVNWVSSNVDKAMTLYFPFTAVPQIGDTYEAYTYNPTPLAASSNVNADYKEDGGSYNRDSNVWAADISAAYVETVQALLDAYPGSTVIANGAQGYDTATLRTLPRDRMGVYYEGSIGNSGYEAGFVSAMTQMRQDTRRMTSFSTLSTFCDNITDYTHARYGLVAALMSDSAVNLKVGASGYQSLDVLYLDEFDVDLGEPASDTTRNADGTWSREYTQAYIVANPTAGSIVVNVPTGFRRILASDYTNQDATLNDGSTNAVSLLTKTAVMFVRA